MEKSLTRGPGFPFHAAIALVLLLPFSCEKDPTPVPDMVIDGKSFFADSIYKEEPDSTGLRIHFLAGSETVEIQTSDTRSGLYWFQQEYFKTVVYPARLIYQDGPDVYLSVSGSLNLENNDGEYAGTFDSVVQDKESVRVVITDGVFRDL